MRRLLPSPADAVDPHEAYALPRADRVHVRVNFVASADGASTLVGQSGGLSGPADKRLFAALRDLADVVLAGAGTVRNEGYGPFRVTAERAEKRRARGLTPAAPIAIVSHSLDLDPAAAIFTEAVARTIVITDQSAPPERRAALAEVADVVVAGDDRVDCVAALDALGARGLRRVLCEGGPALLGDLEEADRVDELCLTVAPLLAGPGADRIVRGMPIPEPRAVRLAAAYEEDDFVFLRYERAAS